MNRIGPQLTLLCVSLITLAVLAGSRPSYADTGQKVILDTDLAGDIDDAFALAYLLTVPDIEILGVTVGTGNTEARARVACRMLYEARRDDIPVAAGRKTSNTVGGQLLWGEGFDKYQPVPTPAADFIIEQLNKYPGQVVVFTVGPVPNIGDIIKKDPVAWRKVKAVYSMFGSFYHGYGSSPVPAAEYNVRADVESARLMIGSGVPITLAGLDVTAMVVLREDRRLKLLFRQSPITNTLCGLYTLWGHENPVLFDPVAIEMFLNDEIVNRRQAHVRVTDEGYTVIDESRPPNATIGLHIDTERFLDRLMKNLLEQNLTR